MRFCTTCGRNFEEAIDVCPHDGTPLFGMAGDEEAAAVPEIVAEAAVAVAPATKVQAPVEVAEEEAPREEEDDEIVVVVSPGAPAEDTAEEDEELSTDDDSEAVTAGIGDMLDELVGDDDDAVALASLPLEPFDAPDKYAPVATVSTKSKKSGNSGLIFVIFLLVAGGVGAWWFLMGAPSTGVSGESTTSAVAEKPVEPEAVTETEESPAPEGEEQVDPEPAAEEAVKVEEPAPTEVKESTTVKQESPRVTATPSPAEARRVRRERNQQKTETPKETSKPSLSPEEALQQELQRMTK